MALWVHGFVFHLATSSLHIHTHMQHFRNMHKIFVHLPVILLGLWGSQNSVNHKERPR